MELLRGQRLLAVAVALFATACVGAQTPSTQSPGDPPGAAGSASQPFDPVTYQGPDRQQRLEEQARKEGSVVLYLSGSLLVSVTGDKIPDPAIQVFQQMYPFIKVDVFTADVRDLVRKAFEEYQAKQHSVDVFEFTPGGLLTLKENGMLQKFHSPHLQYYPAEVMDADKMMVGVRETWVGLGFNTNLVSAGDTPKSYRDLANPRWKGKMAVAGSTTGSRWIGAMLHTEGESFIRGLASQDIRIVQTSARALTDQVISGEFLLSPTIFSSHVVQSRMKGAPVEWLPLDPVVVNLGSVALPSRPPHPAAAMLFVDYLLSRDGQAYYIDRGYVSARTDMLAEAPYKVGKKFIPESVPNYAEQEEKWTQLMRSVFVGR